jgi:hypothetical protein
MHPWMALCLWSITIARIWRNSLSDEVYVLHIRPEAKRLVSNTVNASDYLKSEVIEHPLPDLILDRLAALHLLEMEPAIAI